MGATSCYSDVEVIGVTELCFIEYIIEDFEKLR
jgi:hypothetical protein